MEDEEYSESNISQLYLGNANYNYLDRLIQEEEKASYLSNKKKKYTILDKIYFKKANNIRISICLAILIITYLNTNFSFLYADHEINCVVDYFQDKTLGINKYFSHNVSIKLAITVVISVISDICFLIISVIWLTRSNSYRFIVSLVFLIVLSLISNLLLQLDTSKNNIWEFPGVPGLVLNYSHINTSFVYPIDIGLLFICGFEFKKAKNYLFSNITICTGLILALWKLICQCVYFPGIFISIVIADFIFYSVEYYITYVDKSDFGINKRKLFSI